MGVLRDILDLLVIGEESRKRRVETKLAETELAKTQSVVTLATLEDVQKYDPTTRKIEAVAVRHTYPQAYGAGGYGGGPPPRPSVPLRPWAKVLFLVLLVLWIVLWIGELLVAFSARAAP